MPKKIQFMVQGTAYLFSYGGYYPLTLYKFSYLELKSSSLHKEMQKYLHLCKYFCISWGAYISTVTSIYL